MGAHSESMIQRGASMDGMNVRQALRVYCDLIAAIRPFKSWAAIATMLQDEGVRPISGAGPIHPRTLSTYWREINARGLVDPARSGSIAEALRAEIAKAGRPEPVEAAPGFPAVVGDLSCAAPLGAMSRAAPLGVWQAMAAHGGEGGPSHG